ncbi:MAG: hypothetical protein Q8S73_02870 [Deltaproteobacteria bacterium]|nr:hypothetical protein [Myxococcales bacterium]MDP3213021.1 hypothetical protein [Deltaproteobacteria bacterium]
MSPLFAMVLALVAVLAACVTLPSLASRASHLALALLVAMLPSLWAGSVAVIIWRSFEAADAVRPDAWVRDDSPATLRRLPAIGEPAPREHEVMIRGDSDPSHYGHWSRSFGTFQSGPVTFTYTRSRSDGISQHSESSHGWTCESSNVPNARCEYSLVMRRAPDGMAIAFDCVLADRGGGVVGNAPPTCREDLPPLVFRRVPYAPVPVRGSLRDALAALTASLVLCWVAMRWMQRPWQAPARVERPPVAAGAAPFRAAPVAEEEALAQAELRAFDRAMRARRLGVTLVIAAALVGSIAALPSVMRG